MRFSETFRPAPTAPPAPEQKQPKEICDSCELDWLECGIDPETCEQEEHDAQVAKAERERVLEWAKKHHWPTTGGHRVIGFDKLKEFLESLRAQQEHPSTKGVEHR